MAGTARLPVSVDIEVVELKGPVRIGVTKHSCYCSFLTEPHVRFKVGGWVVGGWVEEEAAVGMRCCGSLVGGWVGR